MRYKLGRSGVLLPSMWAGHPRWDLCALAIAGHKKAAALAQPSQLTQDENGLLPCPCCGSKAKIDQIPHNPESLNSGGYYIECTVCNVTTSLMFAAMGDPLPSLKYIWNKRPSCAPSPQATISDSLKLDRDWLEEHGWPHKETVAYVDRLQRELAAACAPSTPATQSEKGAVFQTCREPAAWLEVHEGTGEVLDATLIKPDGGEGGVRYEPLYSASPSSTRLIERLRHVADKEKYRYSEADALMNEAADALARSAIETPSEEVVAWAKRLKEACPEQESSSSVALAADYIIRRASNG
jgi:hypothetical protein